jgi:hypothetical protein
VIFAFRLSLPFFLALLLMAPSAARADCSTPDGVGGQMIYNTGYNVMQYCNGTAWINMGGVASSVTAAGSTGAIQFNTGNVLDAETALFWDKANDRLGIGTATPSQKLHIDAGSGEARIRLKGGGGAFEFSADNGANLFRIFDNGGTARFAIDSAGDVGIGTIDPSVKLDVAGAIVSRVYNAGSGTSIDWAQSNIAYTSANCGAFTFSNMQDGGSYTLVVQGATAATCSFSHSGLTFKLPVGHGATTVSKHTLYSFLRAGSNVYVTWIPGY